MIHKLALMMLYDKFKDVIPHKQTNNLCNTYKQQPFPDML